MHRSIRGGGLSMKLAEWFRVKGRQERVPRQVASRLVHNVASGDVDAMRRVVELGPDGIPVLRELLDHHDREVRCWTVVTLTDLGQKVDAAAQVLSLALDDHDADVRDLALQGFLAAAHRNDGPSWSAEAI
jgi:hypothetical protein